MVTINTSGSRETRHSVSSRGEGELGEEYDSRAAERERRNGAKEQNERLVLKDTVKNGYQLCC